MSQSFAVEPFRTPADDDLIAEHQRVSEWVEAAAELQGPNRYYLSSPLKALPSGQTLLAGDAEQSRRHVLAAVIQAQHWEREIERAREHAAKSGLATHLGHWPGRPETQGRRNQSVAVISELLRRKLPWRSGDMMSLLQWLNGIPAWNTSLLPLGGIVRAIEQYFAGGDSSGESELQAELRRFTARLSACSDPSSRRLATKIEKLCRGDSSEADSSSKTTRLPPPVPAPAGNDGVFTALKQLLGMQAAEEPTAATILAPDLFPLGDDSPLRREHERLSPLLAEAVAGQYFRHPDVSRLTTGKQLLTLDLIELGNVVLAAAERHLHTLKGLPPEGYQQPVWQSHYVAASLISELSDWPFELGRPALFDWLLYVSTQPPQAQLTEGESFTRWLDRVEAELCNAPLTEGERFVLFRLRAACVVRPFLGGTTEAVQRITTWIGDGAAYCLAPGEVWSDAVNADFAEMSVSKREKWNELFRHTMSATSSRPSAKWLKTATALVKELTPKEFRSRLEHWLPLVSQGGSVPKLGRFGGDTRGTADTMHDENSTSLRGLLWVIPTLKESDELVRLVTSVALTAYKKVPGVGPRAVKVGNAAIYALSEIGTLDAVGQLALLKVRVKFGTAQKEIEKAFNKAAEALGLPRDQIEEMGVPSYGLEPGGVTREQLGDYRAELIVTGSDAQLNWFDAHGKPLKSVPARVKSDFKEELRELKQSQKDIQGMLPAQRDRIDGMFLSQQSWAIGPWRERYLDHPLIGTIARRLLWCVDGTPTLFIDGSPTDVLGQTIPHGQTAEITLWHPVGRPVDDIVAWRGRLEELEMTQPFKQAHREVYLLTDAELRTSTYSNRYAAHVLRQHQFNALCAARGWRNRLRLMVDDSYEPPMKLLPHWGLRAEFWVEGIGDGYGTDTNDAGVYLRLATDQVRFYRLAAAHHFAHAGGGGYETIAPGPGTDNINEPLPLDQIPALVFSEIMRDVDLFVGVASVGNDPTWQDGGPDGRYRDYWQNYSFGELSGTAGTRRQVLERLIPRLKIATRCHFTDRFLVVRGDLRTYKIHLGSGNILMEPNDQYLCIVPDSRSNTKQEDWFLPFEGDKTLSIILSKAFLLADDRKIKDPTITRQLSY